MSFSAWPARLHSPAAGDRRLAPAEEVVEAQTGEMIRLRISIGRLALDPVDLAGPDLDDLVDVVERDRVDLLVDPHQQART